MRIKECKDVKFGGKVNIYTQELTNVSSKKRWSSHRQSMLNRMKGFRMVSTARLRDQSMANKSKKTHAVQRTIETVHSDEEVAIGSQTPSTII